MERAIEQLGEVVQALIINSMLIMLLLKIMVEVM